MDPKYLKLDLYYNTENCLAAIGVDYNEERHCTGDIRKESNNVLSFVLSDITKDKMLLDSMERCVEANIYIKKTIECQFELIYDNSRGYTHIKPSYNILFQLQL